MKAALERRQWDLIISDYIMPKFSGIAALEVLKESGADLPFIIVSGNIGEDIAVGAMKAGAHDYIIKGKLARLIPAVDRELREAADRRERRRAEEAFWIEQNFRRTIEDSILVGIAAVDLSGKLFYANQALCDMVGWSREELEGSVPPLPFWPPESVDELAKVHDLAYSGAMPKGGHELRLMKKGGERFDTLCVISPLRDNEGKPSAWLSTFHDITERKKAARRTEVTNALLNLFTQKFTRKEYLDAACGLIRSWTGCRHAGIRIVDRTGTSLSSPARATTRRSCTGTHGIAASRTSASARGSWRGPRTASGPLRDDGRAARSTPNDTAGFMDDLTGEQRKQYRGALHADGISIARRRPDPLPGKPARGHPYRRRAAGHASRDSVEFLEQLAFIIGEAIFRFGIEEELRKNYDDLQKTSGAAGEDILHHAHARGLPGQGLRTSSA